MKFSIIMAAYNAEKEIKRSIESVLEQTFSDYELIVVNDASTDNTKEVVSQFDKVKLINNEKNIKAGGARNVGLDNAKGEYIIFLDSDDIFVDNLILQRINNNIIENEYPDIVYLGFSYVKENMEKTMLPNEINSQKNNRIRDWKYANVWDVCWNKEFLSKNKIRFVEGRFYEDFPFYYEGVIKSKTYAYIDIPIIKYTHSRNDSMTTKINTQKVMDMYLNMTLLVELYEQIEEPELKKSFEVGALLRQHYNIEYYIKKMVEEK